MEFMESETGQSTGTLTPQPPPQQLQAKQNMLTGKQFQQHEFVPTGFINEEETKFITNYPVGYTGTQTKSQLTAGDIRGVLNPDLLKRTFTIRKYVDPYREQLKFARDNNINAQSGYSTGILSLSKIGVAKAVKQANDYMQLGEIKYEFFFDPMSSRFVMIAGEDQPAKVFSKSFLKKLYKFMTPKTINFFRYHPLPNFFTAWNGIMFRLRNATKYLQNPAAYDIKRAKRYARRRENPARYYARNLVAAMKRAGLTTFDQAAALKYMSEAPARVQKRNINFAKSSTLKLEQQQAKYKTLQAALANPLAVQPSQVFQEGI